MTAPGTAVRPLVAADAGTIAAAFASIGWTDKTTAKYQWYAAQQEAGERVVWVAEHDGDFAGYGCVLWRSDYPPFREAGVPEIVDLNVLPRFRRRGIGSALLAAAEATVADATAAKASAAERSPVVGIGVGLGPDYGPAFRLYVARGYQPDGRGVAYDGQTVRPGATIRVDDSATLYFTRRLGDRPFVPGHGSVVSGHGSARFGYEAQGQQPRTVPARPIPTTPGGSPMDTDPVFNAAAGVPASRLSDEDLRREMASLHRTREDTFKHGSQQALECHIHRTAELEEEYLVRFPEREVDPRRLRAGARAEVD